MTTEEMKVRYTPKMAVREELGGDYYYRCPWIACNKIVRSDMNYCCGCGQRLMFPLSDYEESCVLAEIHPEVKTQKGKRKKSVGRGSAKTG